MSRKIGTVTKEMNQNAPETVPFSMLKLCAQAPVGGPLNVAWQDLLAQPLSEFVP